MDVAVMGFGTVGSGVVEILMEHNDLVSKNSYQDKLNLKYILDIRNFPNSKYKDLLTKDFNDILDDPDVKIVAETMGGVTFAYDFVKRLLESGKSVVTSNKELVAQKGYELLEIAKRTNANFMFEASVGGGIPIIRPLTQCLTANNILEVEGILNGTTNYILTKMITDGISFETALGQAQELGYAEKDPSADVDGLDASRKICILASLCYGKHVYPKDVGTQGIRNVTLSDVENAENVSCDIKLIATAKPAADGKIFAYVGPSLVSKTSLLSQVNDVFNAVEVVGDSLGECVFYGKGAGKLPTASAVVADMIDCAKHTVTAKKYFWDDAVDNYVLPIDDVEYSLYVRGASSDVTDTEKMVVSSFEDVNILSKSADAFAFVTPKMTVGDIKRLLGKIKSFNPDILMRIL